MGDLSGNTITNKTEIATSVAALAVVFCLVYFSFITTAGIVGSFQEQEQEQEPGSAERQRDDLLALHTFTESDKTRSVSSDRNIENMIPERISAPSIGLDANITNPPSVDLETLDQALLSGVVYYPNSGFVGKNSNILLFGHSSFLPIVHNSNFRIFNKIKDLEIGEIISLEAGGRVFEYEVISNRLVKDHEVRVDFDTQAPMLTLATCHSFGEKEDRYVIEAVLVR